jgi:ATP-dependent helicase/nuclease subunit A
MRLPYAGTKIHALLERLRYHPEMDLESQISEWFGNDSPELLEGLEYVRGLDVPPMDELLRTGDVEWGFQVRTKRGVLEGQIDLWGVVDGTVWVIDYKSGSERYKERAFHQLELYAYAIARAGYNMPIKLAIIFPLAQKVDIREARAQAQIAQDYGL